jgi:hypothetical protein
MNSGRAVAVLVLISFSSAVVAGVGVGADGFSGSCSIGFFPDTILAQHRVLEDIYLFSTI